jgi:hypothetical protein
VRNLRFVKYLIAIAAALAVPAPAFANVFIGIGLPSVGVSVNFGPPALPVYVQPPCPAPNEIWTPGYWAWGPYGYYWVPGTWVVAPAVGYLWTPGYWGFAAGAYGWHPGYWGRHIGFYGGINYGFGYFGHGYAGGGWYGNTFRYNTAVTNVNTRIVRNVYVDKTVVNNYNTRNVSYNGGPHGVRALPTPAERLALHDRHVPMTPSQREHFASAASDRSLRASVNHGRPATLAVARPLAARPALAAPRVLPHVAHVAHVAPVRQPAYHAAAIHARAPLAGTREFARPARLAQPRPAVRHVAAFHPVHRAAQPSRARIEAKRGR